MASEAEVLEIIIASDAVEGGREILHEDEGIRSPKVKVGRITEQEEEEERTFIPSAVGVPLNPLFRCDKQCSEKTLSCWQLASASGEWRR